MGKIIKMVLNELYVLEENIYQINEEEFMGWKDIGNVGGSLRRGDVGIENISNGKVIILEKYW